MTVNLQALAIKSEVKVAMRYKNFKAAAMRCKNKGKPKDVTKDCVISQRYQNHTASFRHQSKRNETELSKHIWALKDNNKPFNMKWRIIKQLATNITYAFLRSL